MTDKCVAMPMRQEKGPESKAAVTGESQPSSKARHTLKVFVYIES